MQFENVAIAGVTHVDAPHRIATDALAERMAPALRALGIRPNMLRDLSGIEARRFWDEGMNPSDAATLAARQVLAQTGIDPARVGVLINTSVCRDFVEPSTACIVHGNLALSPDCLNFDLANACLGFINGMKVVGNMIERGQVDIGLVVDGEGSRLVTETTVDRLNALAEAGNLDENTFRQNFATLTLGSGAAAMVLTRAGLTDSPHRFLGGVDLAATEHNGLCRGQRDWMHTDTTGLLSAGLGVAERCWQKAAETLGWTPDGLDHFMLHQVSRVHTEQVTGRLGLSQDKVFRLYPEFGNVGPASVPISLSKSVEAGRVSVGDRIALMGIGSGLNVSMAEVVW